MWGLVQIKYNSLHLLQEYGGSAQISRLGRKSEYRAPMSAVETVRFPAGRAVLEGSLTIPASARGLVVFAHGSGSSRHSPRNRFVADRLNAAGMATLLTDLLTAAEEAQDVRTGALRFDIGLLAARVSAVLDWAAVAPPVGTLPAGLFGASTGAAAALVAAADRPQQVRAVVSRGGRPDLAGRRLSEVDAAVLLIVGGDDREVLDLNRAAARVFPRPPQLEVVPGAGHLFEEAGALDRVAELAGAWFATHLEDT
jgi:dienelactone hydrolase